MGTSAKLKKLLYFKSLFGGKRTFAEVLNKKNLITVLSLL